MPLITFSFGMTGDYHTFLIFQPPKCAASYPADALYLWICVLHYVACVLMKNWTFLFDVLGRMQAVIWISRMARDKRNDAVDSHKEKEPTAAGTTVETNDSRGGEATKITFAQAMEEVGYWISWLPFSTVMYWKLGYWISWQPFSNVMCWKLGWQVSYFSNDPFWNA